MTRLPLAWMLLTASLWTAGSSPILLQEPLKALYPKISSPETIECGCGNVSCEAVYWFRVVPSLSEGTRTQYIGTVNNANRQKYGAGVDESRFKFSKRHSTSFVLRINSVTVDDRGIYSCVLRDKSNTDSWKPGVLLLPGETAPTPPPKRKPKPPTKSVCRCPKKNPSQEDLGEIADSCRFSVFWPLVGLAAGLALAVVCTLYYFSRLQKKCHHHFEKRRRML